LELASADMLVKEILSRNMRDRRAVARYGGLTGSPHESGSKSRWLPEVEQRNSDVASQAQRAR
jgi:hypothetical protein